MDLSAINIRVKLSRLVRYVMIAVLVVHASKGIPADTHQGLYSTHLTDYEVVVPQRVSRDGAFVSHNLTWHHRDGAAPLHYLLPLGGRLHLLDLQPSERFLAPALRVERWRRDAVRTSAPASGRCHYQGEVRGLDGSRVAVSACNGLAGFVSLNGEQFWMEPARGSALPGDEHPHVVFKRSAVTSPVKKRKRKKKRKHEKNCGTREPRRVADTPLEWKQQSGMVKVQGRGKSRKTRWRRSVSRERHVEALVVADSSMMTFHQDGDVETYLLTIMNLVSSLYRDPSIGHPVNVIVVRILLLEEDLAEQGLNITVNAESTLNHFCQWQRDQNPKDDTDPHHHDVAILVTREDICAHSNAPCNTLGVAHVAGMCKPGLSCNVNEDNGISLAHTITHELGHNFGMYHDTEKIGCNRRKGATLHVMTPSFEADTIDIAWSACSRRDITSFLEKGLGGCLEDEPAPQDFSYPDLPPGAMYNAEHQCQLQFGDKDANVCTSMEEICSRLWCGVNDTCTTNLRPAAAGTHCGKHKWCLNQECVSIGERPDPIPGGWGSWGPWTECSRSCGAGVSIKERHCDHPVPAFGGKFCVGERRRYKVCNIEACPEGAPSFRAAQCSSYNDTPFQGKKYTWLPYFEKTDPCELYCSDSDDTLLVPWGDNVRDGTPCNVGSQDMCIAGICKKVGCDWVVDSDAKEDQCGVCRGDGSLCETFNGTYTREDGSGYKEVVVIPSGSRNIKVEEVGNSRNYIGIGSAASRKFFLNGKRQITLAGEYQIAGTPALYEREKDNEKVRIPGPIKEDILIYLIYRGRYRNFGLKYEYTVRKEVTRRMEYSWEFSDWSPCSATCGGGSQSSRPVCREKGGSLVEERKCEEGEEKEGHKMRVCNTHPCPARWWIGPWQLCPGSCTREHRQIVRKRTVMCVGDNEMALPDSDCEGSDRPNEQEPCPNLSPCPTVSPGNHSTSSAVTQLSTTTTTSYPDHDTTSPVTETVGAVTKANTERNILSFEVKPSGRSGWRSGPWGPCSVSCGKGQKKRWVECVTSPCDTRTRPHDVEHCRIQRHCRWIPWHIK